MNSLKILSQAVLLVLVATVPQPTIPAWEQDSLVFYHLRLVRVTWGDTSAGVALFRPPDYVVPRSEWESWGDAAQLDALRTALEATRVEPIPGLVVPAGDLDVGQRLFRVTLGTAVMEIGFRGNPLPGDWHRLNLTTMDDTGGEILDAAFRLQAAGTMAVIAPLPAGNQALAIAVTPLTSPPITPGPGHLEDTIRSAGLDGISPPRLISRARPVYPPAARAAGLTGKVILQAVIRADGRPDGITVLQMPREGEWLAGAAVEAVRQWRYEPARTPDGRPVDAYFRIVMEFSLQS